VREQLNSCHPANGSQALGGELRFVSFKSHPLQIKKNQEPKSRIVFGKSTIKNNFKTVFEMLSLAFKHLTVNLFLPALPSLF